jgi:hypothetical protein
MAAMGSVTVHVDTPNLPLKAEVEYDPDGYGKRREHVARITLGNVTLMERRYTSDYVYGQYPQPNDFVHNEEDAVEKIANEFGAAFLKVLEASPVWEG